MSVDKVDNQTIECMVCASCTFKGEKRQEERKIDRSEGEAGVCSIDISYGIQTDIRLGEQRRLECIIGCRTVAD